VTRKPDIADNGCVDDGPIVGTDGIARVQVRNFLDRLFSAGDEIESTVPVLRVHYNKADDGRGVAIDTSIESAEEEWDVGSYVKLNNEQTRELIEILEATIEGDE